MSRYRRIRIRTATREVLAIRHRPAGERSNFCTRCEDAVVWLGLQDAADVRELPPHEIVELIENNELHYRETADGRLVICLKSILKGRHPSTKTLT